MFRLQVGFSQSTPGYKPGANPTCRLCKWHKPGTNRGKITIDLGNLDKKQWIAITVTDMLGRTIISRDVNTDGLADFDISKLSKGIYLVNVKRNAHTQVSEIAVTE